MDAGSDNSAACDATEGFTLKSALRAVLVPFFVEPAVRFRIRPRAAILTGIGALSLVFVVFVVVAENYQRARHGTPFSRPLDLLAGAVIIIPSLAMWYGGSVEFWCWVYRRFAVPPYVADIWQGECRLVFLAEVWFTVIVKTCLPLLVFLTCQTVVFESLGAWVPIAGAALNIGFLALVLVIPSVGANLAIPAVARSYCSVLQPRCWACGYSLQGLGVNPVCPECGCATRPEKGG